MLGFGLEEALLTRDGRCILLDQVLDVKACATTNCGQDTYSTVLKVVHGDALSTIVGRHT